VGRLYAGVAERPARLPSVAIRARLPASAPCGRLDGFQLWVAISEVGFRLPSAALRAHDLVVNCGCNPLDESAILSGLSTRSSWGNQAWDF